MMEKRIFLTTVNTIPQISVMIAASAHPSNIKPVFLSVSFIFESAWVSVLLHCGSDISLGLPVVLGARDLQLV